MRQKKGSLCRAEIGICLLGLAASIVPSLVYTDAFWGVDGFMDKEPFATTISPGVVVTQIAPASPAALVGLQTGDRVVTVNGKRADFGTFRRLLADIRPEESVTLDVTRSGQELRLVSDGAAPTLDGVLFLDWQFVSASIFLVVLLLMIATEPIAPAPLWRPILAILGGLIVLGVTVTAEVTHFAPWTAVWQSKAISHGPSPLLHYSLTVWTLLAGLALSVLAACDVRAALIRRYANAPEKQS
jgi:membrane-associated protease RseP (regulator of RpoE activity)